MLRRIEVEPHDGLQLFGELRIVTDLERLYQMWFEAVCAVTFQFSATLDPCSRSLLNWPLNSLPF
jgi:hypothetical protein